MDKLPSVTRRVCVISPDCDYEFVEVDDPGAAFVEGAVRATPWWAISLAFHGIVLASLPLIIFSQQLLGQDERPPIKITCPRVARPRLEVGEHARGIVDRDAGVPTVLADEPRIIFPGEPASDRTAADGEDYSSLTPGRDQVEAPGLPEMESAFRGPGRGQAAGLADHGYTIGTGGGGGSRDVRRGGDW